MFKINNSDGEKMEWATPIPPSCCKFVGHRGEIELQDCGSVSRYTVVFALRRALGERRRYVPNYSWIFPFDNSGIRVVQVQRRHKVFGVNQVGWRSRSDTRFCWPDNQEPQIEIQQPQTLAVCASLQRDLDWGEL